MLAVKGEIAPSCLTAPIATRDELNGIASGPGEAAPTIGAPDAAGEVTGSTFVSEPSRR